MNKEDDSLRGVSKIHSRFSGFTIVELLVVIVVIGILAAITIVSYSGITNKANIASLSSDLDNAAKQLKLFQIDNSNYPATISTDCINSPDSDTNKCLKVSNGATYEYYVVNTANNQNFCITATKGSYSYSINNNGSTIPTAYCPVLYLDASNSLSYPGAGNNKWYDLSGNNNNGTLNGGVSYSTANGGVMGFDGVDDYVRVANKLSGTVGTVCFFIKGDSPGLWTDIFTIDTGVDSTSSRVENAGNGNYMWYGSSGGFTSGSQIFSHYGLQWDYISLVFDGTAARSYKNGILSYQGPISDSFPVAANINIGRRNSGMNWKGSISSFNIYDRALTVDEVIQNFNATKARYGL